MKLRKFWAVGGNAPGAPPWIHHWYSHTRILLVFYEGLKMSGSHKKILKYHSYGSIKVFLWVKIKPRPFYLQHFLNLLAYLIHQWWGDTPEPFLERLILHELDDILRGISASDFIWLQGEDMMELQQQSYSLLSQLG